jgi:hypothetical protein
MAEAYNTDGPDKRDVLAEARRRLEAAWDHDSDNRTEAIKDLRFLGLDQWPEDVRQKRESEGRPVLTLDHLNQHKNQVVNDIRQANISLKAIPVDSKTDPALAEIVTALMRDVQYQSHAEHVYAQAADGAVSCGIGHFRFKTRYVDDRVFEQELLIEPIPYPLAVFWDPAAVKPDRSDAMWCFVTEFVPTGTFKQRYPHAQMADVDAMRDIASASGMYWATRDGVLIAEYWCKKPKKRRLVAFEDGSVVDLTDAERGIEEQLVQVYGPVQGEREAQGYKIEQSIISGVEVLEGPHEWAGQYIPIIPVIGSEIHLETKTIRMSLIRGARDPQRLYNYWRSAAAELIALVPKSKFLVTDKQIAPYRAEWEQAHLSPKPYLRFVPDDKMPRGMPQKIDPADPPAAIWQEASLVVDDMKAATGIYDASLGAKSNETSGVAIARRQVEGDVSTYHFADNLRRSLEHAGRVMIDLIPKIYDTQRVVRLLGEDGQEKFEQINWPTIDTATGESVVYNDLSSGRYDIRVSIGPSYTTQRIEARETLIEFMKAIPQAAPYIMDLVASSLDFDGADDIAERLKKLIPPQILPEDERPAPEQPNPAQMQAQEMQLKAMGAKVAETEGKARKAHAEADAKEIENQERVVQDHLFGVPPPQHALPPSPPGGMSPGQ